MDFRWKKEFLSSRIGRRLFLLFFVCALVPILLLAGVTYFNVTNQLTKQAYRSLQVSAKNSGMFVFMNLLDLETEMNHVISESGLPDQQKDGRPTHGFGGFSRIVRIGIDGVPPHSPETGSSWPILSRSQKKELITGQQTLIFQSGGEGELARVYMAGIFPDNQSILLCELDQAGIGKRSGLDFKPVSSDFHVLTRNGEMIYSSRPEDLPELRVMGPERKSQAQFRWRAGGQNHLVSQWELFLGSHFNSESWVISTSRPESDVLSPVKGFVTWFFWVIALSISAIALLSLVQIRRTMNPLAVLSEGTRSVAEGNFDMALEVDSQDEFSDLAGSFNEMSRQLARQFKIMASVGEIGRAALSSLEKEKIVEILTTRMGKVLACGSVTLCLREGKGTNVSLAKVDRDSFGLDELGRFPLGEENIEDLNKNHDHGIHMPGSAWSRFLSLATESAESAELVLPLFLKSRLVGAVSLSYPQLTVLGVGPFHERLKNVEIPLARQLADQFVVALSNAELVQNLNQMNWGILHTLARAVDAKTPWTSGHSERVCDVALELGRELGYKDRARDILHRGALLHDLGKLGIPDQVLDKPGKLSDEEFNQIRQHPEIGARILEPANFDNEILCMVRHHHEHWDGRGYPDGLQGEDISPYARIIAVADVFDALVSDRPYRKGWTWEKSIGFISEGRDRQFAPEVVDAFLKVSEKTDFRKLYNRETSAENHDLEAVK
jgi:putative nucleotidyltransferase with HDIG domain